MCFMILLQAQAARPLRTNSLPQVVAILPRYFRTIEAQQPCSLSVNKGVHLCWYSRPGYKPSARSTTPKLRHDTCRSNDRNASSAAPIAERDAKSLLFRHIDMENRRTATYLHRSHTQSVRDTRYETIYNEIQQAAMANEEAILQSDAGQNRMGPTGRYAYRWVVAATQGVAHKESEAQPATGSSTRIYQRSALDKGHTNADVLGNDWKKDRILNMSLSVDEMAMAFLVQSVESHSSARAILRLIDVGQSIELIVDDQAMTQLVSIEFGPKARNGSHSLFAVTADCMDRPATVWAATVDLDALIANGGPGAAYAPSWKMIYRSEDPKEYVEIHRTKGLGYVAINSRTQPSNEIYLVRPGLDGDQTLLLVRQREHGVMYHVDVGSDQDVFILTHRQLESSSTFDYGCQTSDELALFQAAIQDLPLHGNWGRPVSGSERTNTRYSVVDFDLFEDYITLYERSTVDGAPRIRVVGRTEKLCPLERLLPLPEDMAMLSPAGNMFYSSKSLCFYAESPVASRQLLKYNMETGYLSDRTLPDPSTAPADTKYVQKRLLVPSKDGTKVPLSLFFKTSCSVHVPLRIVLLGYGAYGAPLSLGYDPSLQPLLDRGCILAFAHTRGGGDLGWAWHQGGIGVNKPRAVEDYLACAEFLSSDCSLFGNRSSDTIQLIAKGRSAGGILIGAAVNQQPSLFDKVVLTSAFLNLDATLRRPDLPLTQHEWDEYGNPLMDDVAARTIASVCPVLNVPDKSSMLENCRKPKFLLVAALDDRSVPIDNTLAYGTAIRKTFGAQVFIHIESTGGHELEVNRAGVSATVAAFILKDESEASNPAVG